MAEPRLVVDLVLAVVAAFVGGVVAQRLRQPAIIGYLVAGIAIGPFTPGPAAEPESIAVLAEIGVAFLMFALGAEFSRVELRRLGRVATLGGTLQIVATMTLGAAAAPLLGFDLTTGVFLGALLALSSTVVAVTALATRGELQSLHGRVAVGILVAQDLAVVPMVVLLPALGAREGEGVPALARTLVVASVVVAGAYLVGARAFPWVLAHAARGRREVFLLGVVSVALGTALVTHLAGLSLAFGAFLAGLAVAESEFRAQVVAEVLPLRDLFASLFFVSVGMLVDPAALASAVGVVAALTALVVIGKGAIGALVVLALGMPGRVALLAGAAIAQIGEFSFLLGRVGVDSGAIPRTLFDLTLATAFASIVLSPLALRVAPPLAVALARLPLVGVRFAEPTGARTGEAELRRHAVICGYGRVARELAAALEARGLHYLVIEYNPGIARELRARGVPVIYGDAANPAVLEHARLEHASLLAVLMPDPVAAENTVRLARRTSARLDIVARASDAPAVDRLRSAGANDVVQPEFEAGVEVIRHALRRYGASGAELTAILAGRRSAYYRRGDETQG